MDSEKILEKVAESRGITKEELCAELQRAIRDAWETKDERVQDYQRKTQCGEKIPTPEELVEFLLHEIYPKE